MTEEQELIGEIKNQLTVEKLEREEYISLNEGITKLEDKITELKEKLRSNGGGGRGMFSKSDRLMEELKTLWGTK